MLDSKLVIMSIAQFIMHTLKYMEYLDMICDLQLDYSKALHEDHTQYICDICAQPNL